MSDEVAAARASAGSDLKFLLDREMVDSNFQDQLLGAGVNSVKQFAALVKDRDELMTVLDSEFTIPGEGLVKRVAMSRIVVAWETARARASKAAEAEADCEVMMTPKQVRPNDFRAMKETYESTWLLLEPTVPTSRRSPTTWRRESYGRRRCPK